MNNQIPSTIMIEPTTLTKSVPLLGRPGVITDLVEWQLQEALTKGLNTSEACAMAGISRQTYYMYYRDNPTFADKMESAKQRLGIRAKMNIADKIEAGDPATSAWYLERKFKHKLGFVAEDGEADLGDTKERALSLLARIERGEI